MGYEPWATGHGSFAMTEYCIYKAEEREKLKGNDKPWIYWWNLQIKYELHDIQIVSCCVLAKTIAQEQRTNGEKKNKTTTTNIFEQRKFVTRSKKQRKRTNLAMITFSKHTNLIASSWATMIYPLDKRQTI